MLVTVPRASRSCENFPDGFDLRLLLEERTCPELLQASERGRELLELLCLDALGQVPHAPVRQKLKHTLTVATTYGRQVDATTYGRLHALGQVPHAPVSNPRL